MKPAAPAPPPPPPPPPQSSTSQSIKKQLADSLRQQQEQQQKKSPEEIIATLRQQRSLEEGLVCYSVYNEVHSVIQEGPQCGLVALCMAAQVLHCAQPAVDDVVQMARHMGFTKQGEMFSAINMCSLACTALHCHGQVVSLSSSASSIDCLTKLLSHRRRAALLVPYDKDRNHAPCTSRRGHSAHWAMVSGALALGPRCRKSTFLQDVAKRAMTTEEDEEEEGEECKQEVDGAAVRVTTAAAVAAVSGEAAGSDGLRDDDSNKPAVEGAAKLVAAHGDNNEEDVSAGTLLYHLQQPLSIEEATALCSLHHVYVYANQGKSIHTHLWNFNELIESNRQLVELDPEIAASQEEYYVGEGICSGLCGQAVFLWAD